MFLDNTLIFSHELKRVFSFPHPVTFFWSSGDTDRMNGYLPFLLKLGQLLCWCLVSHSCPTLLRPHGLQPSRLLCPWDSVGKNTGVGGHFLLQGICLIQGSNLHLLCLLYWQTDSSPLSHLGSTPYNPAAAAAAKSLQSCPTLCDPIDCSPPGSPVPGILQARTLEWVAISFSNAWKWKVKSESEVTQSCPTLSDPMDCSLSGSSIHFSRQEYNPEISMIKEKQYQ